VSRLHGLYSVTDEKLIVPEQFSATIKQILQGGGKIIQYRNKSNNENLRKHQAIELKRLCNQYKALFIINDDVELARQVKADGVHLGQNDSSISQARTALGKQAIIGVSCHNRFDLAQQAQNEGADYVAFGAFFSSTIKPDACTASIELLAQAKQQLSIPVCAIGGINIDNAAQLVTNGADMIAVISGLLTQKDIASSAQKLSALFQKQNHFR
jgi:thiamine-phosphate pyrophosphorylase